MNAAATAQVMPPPSWWDDRRIILVLLLGGFVTWVPEHAFFWRDEWEFLQGFKDAPVPYLFKDHYGHVVPLFKLAYYTELRAFGTNAIFYAYANLIFFGLANYAVFRLTRALSSKRAAWILAVAMTVHPLMFNHLGWSFQQCITLHMLAQVLAVAAFLRWVNGNGPAATVYSATIAQHFCFGNGIFLPLLFSGGAVLMARHRPWQRMSMGMTIIWAGFVLTQLALGGDRHSAVFGAGAIADITRAWTYFQGTTLSAIFFIRPGVIGALTPWLAGAVFIGLSAMAWLNRRRDQKTVAFLIGWFLCCTCSIPLVMQDGIFGRTLPYYYFALATAPVLLIVEHAFGGRVVPGTSVRKVLSIAGCLLVVGAFVLDQYAKGLFSYRAMRNRQYMMRNLQEGTPYSGFDEPYFREVPSRMPEPSGLYRYWTSKDLFRMPDVPDHLEPVAQ